MFCNQCEQAAKGTGCEDFGICGKDEDVQSLQETLLYGLKGMAAYAHHARRLGKVDEAVSAFTEEALFATMTNVNFDVPSLLELVLECGKQNLRVMQMLDEAHVERYGQPAVGQVATGTRPRPGILVTGHDLLDLEHLLAQVEGTDVLVYTHGEMLPAHMYPVLKNHPHLAGHFGGAWQLQKTEFEAFGGAILATTNCILEPRESYKDRVFTTRVTAVPGGTRLRGDDFSAVIARAKALGPLPERTGPALTVGFHHSVILGAAPAILDAVAKGEVTRFFVIGGCDGAEPGRNYFSDFAKNAPATSFILTLGCGKFRILDHDYGTLLGLPRLLDMGQCNNAYGAIQVAVGLAGALQCGVNDLPLTIVLSWFEQKAVAVLLTLLHLGVKNIAVGPAAPAFLSPNVFKVLQDAYGLKLTGTDAKADMALV
ncbi:hydroxylamine reductase [Mesoterricola silvestris]|uniref:Hydroxylamine reductase n=1 Tax=Mesoterricola silvestris TaxID=2927979 RepID=A0AA48GXR6_9BACT|nr:hydroxylamine reductase [Mesoterricola silvestris]BDU72298.1 hydroxylamine reductase [Mesoterricola silvestris]